MFDDAISILLVLPFTYRGLVYKKSSMISVWMLRPKQNINLQTQRREILMNSLGEILGAVAKPHKAVSS